MRRKFQLKFSPQRHSKLMKFYCIWTIFFLRFYARNKEISRKRSKKSRKRFEERKCNWKWANLWACVIPYWFCYTCYCVDRVKSERTKKMEVRIRHDIPKGAIILTKYEALSNQIELITNWKPRSDVYITPLCLFSIRLSCFSIERTKRLLGVTWMIIYLIHTVYRKLKISLTISCNRISCKTVLYFRWSLLFGRPILAGAVTLSSLYINQRFRRKLKFQKYGLLPTMAGVGTGPAVASSLLYTEVQSASRNWMSLNWTSKNIQQLNATRGRQYNI